MALNCTVFIESQTHSLAHNEVTVISLLEYLKLSFCLYFYTFILLSIFSFRSEVV